VGSSLFFFGSPRCYSDKQTSSKAPAAPGIRSPAGAWSGRAAQGAIEIHGAGGERATGACFCVARAALFFACVRRQAAAAKKQENRPQAAQKNVFCFIKALYIALSEASRALRPATAGCTLLTSHIRSSRRCGDRHRRRVSIVAFAAPA
jgi:hypothetical protein